MSNILSMKLERSLVILVVILLTGCGGGPEGDVLVKIPDNQSITSTAKIASLTPVTYNISEFNLSQGTGQLPGRIGERKTIGNISLGMVSIDPPPSMLLTKRIDRQMSSAGHRKSQANPSVIITGDVKQFEFHTDVTPTYWDMVVNANVDIRLAHRRKSLSRNYIEHCEERTYIYPSGELIQELVARCADSIANQFSNDQRVQGFINASSK
jgi:hypothetical protein